MGDLQNPSDTSPYSARTFSTTVNLLCRMPKLLDALTTPSSPADHVSPPRTLHAVYATPIIRCSNKLDSCLISKTISPFLTHTRLIITHKAHTNLQHTCQVIKPETLTTRAHNRTFPIPCLPASSEVCPFHRLARAHCPRLTRPL